MKKETPPAAPAAPQGRHLQRPPPRQKRRSLEAGKEREGMGEKEGIGWRGRGRPSSSPSLAPPTAPARARAPDPTGRQDARTLSPRAFARIVGRKRSEVLGWCAAGQIPCGVTKRGRYRIRAEVLERYLTGGEGLPDGLPVGERGWDEVRDEARYQLQSAAALLVIGQDAGTRERLLGVIGRAAAVLAEEAARRGRRGR